MCSSWCWWPLEPLNEGESRTVLVYVERTRADKDDAGDADMKLFGGNVLEHPSVDEEWLVLVNSSVGLDDQV